MPLTKSWREGNGILCFNGKKCAALVYGHKFLFNIKFFIIIIIIMQIQSMSIFTTFCLSISSHSALVELSECLVVESALRNKNIKARYVDKDIEGGQIR